MTRHRQPNKHRPRRAIRRVVAMLLVGLLAMTAACTPENSAESPRPTVNDHQKIIRPQNNRYLREDEWVRMLAIAVNNPDQRLAIWNSIPTPQRQEISDSEFLGYIQFLSDSLSGSIVAYEHATEQEADAIRRHSASSDMNITPRPSEAAIWWLISETSDQNKARFSIPVTFNDDRVPYFSKSWLQRQVALNEYIRLYFDALKKNAALPLYALLTQGAPPRSRVQDDAYRIRVRGLLDYYRDYVDLDREGNYRCVSMMPGHATVEQTLTTPSYGNGTPTRRTVVFTESDGRFEAYEKIPETLRYLDSTFYLDNQSLFQETFTDIHIDSRDLLPRLGVPIIFDIEPSQDPAHTDFTVAWPGLTIEATGQCERSTLSFQGNVKQASVDYSRFSTRSGLSPGTSMYELLKRYPFAKENGYTLTDHTGKITRTLSIQLESGFIGRLTLVFDR